MPALAVKIVHISIVICIHVSGCIVFALYCIVSMVCNVGIRAVKNFVCCNKKINKKGLSMQVV